MTRLLLIFGLFLTFFSSGAAYAKDSTEASFTIPADYSKELSAQKDNYSIAFTPVSAYSKNAETSDNTLLYRDVQPETNIIYQALDYGLKESIVLKSASSPKEFSWQIRVSENLTIKRKGQSLVFFDKSASPAISSSLPKDSWPKEKIFEIPAPFMVDAKGRRSDNVKLEILNFKLKITLDEAFLKNASYPVLVDPTIYSGPNSPSTTIDDATVGTVAWTNPNDSQTSNDLYAAAIPPAGDNTTHYLKATGFGFAIPATAIIKGIVVEIERKDIPAASGSYSKDSTVRIVKGGTIGATDRADTATNWPTTDTYKTYGGSSDLWGLAWTPTDINASSFGAAISAFIRTPISCYVDSDHDGYGAGSVQNCYGSIGTGYSANNTDCNDGNVSLYQNLTGYTDADHDGYGTGSSSQVCSGASLPVGYATNSTDCNDGNVSIYRYLTGYADADNDTYTTGSSQQVCSGASLPSGWRAAANGADCNDGNSSLWQMLTGYRDADGDGYGAPGAGSYCSGASLPAGYVTNGSDCNDSNASLYHNLTGYTDNDHDGYGTGGAQSVCSGASLPYGYTSNASDCNDGNASLYQNITGYQDSDMDNYTTGGAQSVCSGASLPSGWRSYSNGADCNDGNASLWQMLTGYRDADADGYGAAGAGSYCSGASLPAGYVTNGSDCYDGNGNARPGQTGWFTTNRGDGSFDYDCVLGTTKRYTVSNMPAVGSCVGVENCPNPAYYEGLESDVACGVASATKMIDWRNNTTCGYAEGNGGSCRGSGSSLCCAGTNNTSYIVARTGSTVQECH